MSIEHLDDLADPRLDDYRHVPDPELLRRGEIFVAEGRLVVRALLTASPFAARSVLVTETALEALRDAIEPRLQRLPVYVVSQGAIQHLTGFNIHRGCLAIGERPARRELADFLAGSREGTVTGEVWGKTPALPGSQTWRFAPHLERRPLVVLEHVVDADNVGAIFRNAAAFGVGTVVLGPNCCDPLYRKAIRTSMGAALRVPFVHGGEWPGALQRLRQAGFLVVALTPRPDAVSIEDFARSRREQRLAFLAGSEGPGLSRSALAAADVLVRIPMASGVDSLNVATAVAIALHRLSGLM